VDSLGPVPTALVVEDPRGDLAAALSDAGVSVTRWNRRVHAGHLEAAPWPPTGPFELAAVRLPRAKEELQMTLAAVASVLAPGGRLLVFGANDEGIKSIAKRLNPFSETSTAAVGGHCRVLSAALSAESGGPTSKRPTPSLDGWKRTWDPNIPELGTDWVSFPGMFAHGTIDAATRLLLSTLPDDLSGTRVLDYGAGTGVIGGVCAARGAQVDLLDADAVALHAAEKNVPGAGLFLADSLTPTPMETYDWIVSNPPIHRGKAELHDALFALISGAPQRLVRRGRLRLVVQRRLAIEDAMNGVYASVERLADDAVFKVVEAQTR